MTEEYAAIFCVVGGKGHLSDSQLSEILGHLNGVAMRTTAGTVHLVIDGFDDDPRELWQIPEVQDYLSRLAMALDPAVIERFDADTRTLCAICCGMLRPTGRDPVTGNYQFERVV